MIVASLAEVFTIGAVLPFLGVLTAPDKIFAHDSAQPFITLLQIKSLEGLLLPFTFLFILAAVFAGLARITLLWVQTRLSIAIGGDFSVQVYERTLFQPYSFHISRNSSEILAGLEKATNLVVTIIQPVMVLISSLVILIAVIATLLAIEPVIALTAFLGFGLIYAVVVSVTKRRIANNSKTIAVQQGRVTKAVQEGLGGIRDVLIDGTQPVYRSAYENAFLPLRRAIASNNVIAASPRFGVESLGMVLIAGLAFILAEASGSAVGSNNTIPILGALALGAQRLIPVLQQIYYAYITIKGNRDSTQDALDLLEQPAPEKAFATPAIPMAFRTSITLKDLGFRYTPQEPWVFRNLNLEIAKGSRVGFVGITGSGKSTLLDILMGLLPCTEGALLVDNIAVTLQNTRAWQAHISHVPQAIFLSDTSIAENIAFGVPRGQIDLHRLKQASRQADLDYTIAGWRNGFDTQVGERGVRLSGGQRQRIGIARALYKQANLLILDEATSSLDIETEAAVMEGIESVGRDITILIIAHRLSTLKNCDRIIELSNGGIKSTDGCSRMTLQVR
jgi:ABC-type multidrug transport system fused ATPase/permease subunit